MNKKVKVARKKHKKAVERVKAKVRAAKSAAKSPRVRRTAAPKKVAAAKTAE